MSQENKVLVVDNDRMIGDLLKEVLGKVGYQVVLATSGSHALRVFAEEFFPVVILDIVMVDMDGLAVLKAIREQRPETKVIMLTGYASVEFAIQALRLGAFDYLVKDPQVWNELPQRVEKAFAELTLQVDLQRQNIQLRRELERVRGFAGMVGTSPSMQRLYQMITQVAGTDATILIQGETGTGKELVARAIHEQSGRREHPFVIVDCNIPESVAESELFGVTKNYPGFHRKEALIGQVELADGGTLFLDEVGDLALSVQARILRTLQEREIRPLGAEHAVRVDIRIIAATNRNLEHAMRHKEFREDLFYRLNIMTVETPPLRARKEDIPSLVQHFLERMCGKLKRSPLHMTDEALRLLLDYEYPGNVRELENIIERAVILTSGDTILPRVILVNADPSASGTSASSSDLSQKWSQLRLAEAHHALEKLYLEDVLRQTRGNISQAAQRAGIDRKNLKLKLRKHRISSEPFRNEKAG